MKLHMFSIFDDKARAFLPPFFLPEIGLAVRSFGDGVNDPSHGFGRHPEDYTLFLVGSFDQASGIVAPEAAPRVICPGVQLKRPVEVPPQGELRLVGKE